MIQTIPLLGKDKMLEGFLREINPAFSHPQLKNTTRFIQGISSSLAHKSLNSIANALLDPLDQSSLNRFLNDSDWGCEIRELDINRMYLMQKQRQTAFSQKGVFCLDDTLLNKAGKSMDMVNEHFDHCTFSIQNGLSLVSMTYLDENKNYNLLKEVYQRKSHLEEMGLARTFKTKVELAQEMIETLFTVVPTLPELRPHFLFDSWFLAKDLISLLEQHGVWYVSRAKSNRVIEGLSMNLKDYAATYFEKADFTPHVIRRGKKPLVLYCYTAIFPIQNLGNVKVVFSKLDKDQKVSFFLVTNHLRLQTEEIIDLYKLRWGIETDYKFSKQEIGLEEFHVRKKEGILRYLTLCFIASTFLEYCRLMGGFGRYFGKETVLDTKGKSVRAYRHLMFERFLIWVYEQSMAGVELQELLWHFREKSSRDPKGILFTCQSTRLLLNSGTVGDSIPCSF